MSKSVHGIDLDRKLIFMRISIAANTFSGTKAARNALDSGQRRQVVSPAIQVLRHGIKPTIFLAVLMHPYHLHMRFLPLFRSLLLYPFRKIWLEFANPASRLT